MLFALMCRDKPGQLALRQATRADHLAFLASLGDDLIFAGPTLDAEGGMDGSIVVVRATDQAGAEAIAAGDPYAKAGLFASVTVKGWKWAVKRPEGLVD